MPTKWGELTPSGVRRYPLHRYQAAVLGSPARITFASAGTGGGKTCITPLWLLRQIERNDGGGRYLVVSPTYKIFKQSRLLDQFLEAVEGTQLQGRNNKTDSIYTCATGAEVFFRSADSPDSLEGGQYQALAIDEAAKLSHDAWIKASARVGAQQGPILLVSTPDVNNWLYEEIFKLCDGPLEKHPRGAIRTSLDGTIRTVQWISTVNPTYSTAELERQRRILPDAIFRRRYLGEFTTLEGLVYPLFGQAVVDGPPPRILPSPAVRVVGGIDWGWSDPCAVTVGAECQDGVLYLLEEIYESHLPLDMLAQKLRRLQHHWGVEMFFCDHSRPEIQNQLRRLGIPVQTRKIVQIETGIAMVDARIRTGHLKVFSICEHLIDEANTYQRKSTGEGDYSERPVDANNHACDSLRYLVTGLDYGRTLNFSKPPELPASDQVEVAVRLGQVPEDPQERDRAAEAERARLHNERLVRLMDEDAD